MKFYRIVKAKWKDRALDGESSYLCGGRWNSPGCYVVYLSSTISLAQLENLVYIDSVKAMTETKYVRFEITIADDLVRQLSLDNCPINWQDHPPPIETQALGDQWYQEQSSVALMVPSVIVPQEVNIMLNVSHPGFKDIDVKGPYKFSFDPRLAVK